MVLEWGAVAHLYKLEGRTLLTRCVEVLLCHSLCIHSSYISCANRGNYQTLWDPGDTLHITQVRHTIAGVVVYIEYKYAVFKAGLSVKCAAGDTLFAHCPIYCAVIGPCQVSVSELLG